MYGLSLQSPSLRRIYERPLVFTAEQGRVKMYVKTVYGYTLSEPVSKGLLDTYDPPTYETFLEII